jgi:thiol-disulfide isomerase/thioredoxin
MFIRGQEVECYRIELTNHDLKIPRPYPFTQTVWIEKKSLIVREIVENFVGTYNRPGRLTDTFAAVKTIFYTQVDLGGASSGEDFRFAPPEQAHLVSEFADRAQLQPPEEVQILGRQVSNLDLRSIRGSQTNLESYRGHPILIDLWATWCAPCIEGFSSIAELNRLLSPLGVVVVSIDQSDDAKDAEAFFEKLKYPWPNYHDFGEVSVRFGSEAVPRIVLINAEGKVVFDAVAATDDEIKVAIAKLGKEYAGALRR